MEKLTTPTFEFENAEGQIAHGEVLPAVKDLKKLWHELFMDNETPEDAEIFANHVQLFELDKGKSTEHYLVLTDVKAEKAEEFKKIFGTQNEPVPMGIFLSEVAHAKATKKLPESFSNSASSVYRIIS